MVSEVLGVNSIKSGLSFLFAGEQDAERSSTVLSLWATSSRAVDGPMQTHLLQVVLDQLLQGTEEEQVSGLQRSHGAGGHQTCSTVSCVHAIAQGRHRGFLRTRMLQSVLGGIPQRKLSVSRMLSESGQEHHSCSESMNK